MYVVNDWTLQSANRRHKFFLNNFLAELAFKLSLIMWPVAKGGVRGDKQYGGKNVTQHSYPPFAPGCPLIAGLLDQTEGLA